DDTPAAERRAQALSLDRDLLRELLGQEELRDLIDPGALAEIEKQLRGEPRSPDELHDLLRRRGDLRGDEYPDDLAEPLVAERLRGLRRASLAARRREVEPAEQAAFGRFLPSWHGVDRRSSLREALVPLQGLGLPAALWENDLLPRRVPGYRPEQLDALCASGEVVWIGAGLDRVAIYFRE